MSAQILTLCPSCEALLHEGFQVTRVSVKTETPKHSTCDRCKKKFSSTILSQYTVIAKKK